MARHPEHNPTHPVTPHEKITRDEKMSSLSSVDQYFGRNTVVTFTQSKIIANDTLMTVQAAPP